VQAPIAKIPKSDCVGQLFVVGGNSKQSFDTSSLICSASVTAGAIGFWRQRGDLHLLQLPV